MRDDPAQGPNSPHRIRKKNMRGRAPPLRIAGREMRANVAIANRAKHGVGNRVQRHIRVGMARQGVRMRDFHPAEPHMIARGESMDVKALADANVGGPME